MSQAVGAPDPLPPIILANSVNLLAGAPGVGKTSLIADFLRRLRDGEVIFGKQPHKVPAIGVISADRSWQKSSSYWFDLAGFGEIPAYSLVDDRTFNPDQLRFRDKRVDILKRCFDKLALPKGSLILTDPMSLFLGGNLNDYDSCAMACMKIQRLLQDYDYTTIGSAHAGKQQADMKARYLRLQDRIIGSAALFGYTDTQMYLASPQETGEKTFTFLWHPHHAPAEFFSLTRQPNGQLLADGKLITADLEDPQTIASDIERILALFPTDGTPIAATTLLERLFDLQMSRATLFRRLKELIEDGKIHQPTRGQYARVRPS